MDGQNSPQPSFELPAPLKAPETAGAAPVEGQPQNPLEVLKPAAPEAAPVPGNSAAQGQAPAMPIIPQVPVAPGASQPPTGQAAPSVAAPAVAGDVDVIEKEWVQKAKEIVNRTREDPHLQNQQLTAYKADYIKKRYNKQVKVADDLSGS